MQQTMKRLVTGILLIIVLLIASLPANADPSARRIALVIGNSQYRHVPQLENPPNDARLIAGTLRRLGFDLVGGKPQLNLDRDAMVTAIRAFGQQITEKLSAKPCQRTTRYPAWRIASLCGDNQCRVVGEGAKQRQPDTAGHEIGLKQA